MGSHSLLPVIINRAADQTVVNREAPMDAMPVNLNKYAKDTNQRKTYQDKNKTFVSTIVDYVVLLTVKISQLCKYIYFFTLIAFAIISTLQLMTVFDLHKELAMKIFTKPLNTQTSLPPAGAENTQENKNIADKPDWNENIQLVRLAAMLLRQEELLEQKQNTNLSPEAVGGININNNTESNLDLKKIRDKIQELPPDLISYIKALSGYGTDESFYITRVPAVYIGMPIMMLTLLISLWMGVLGSTIRMIFELLTTENKYPFHWYVFQPLQGALLAFAVFILFKAGHLSLSGGGATGIGGELNPYIIAFVGIVSGMLSEKAYRKIGIEGSRLLADDTLPRYVRPDVAVEQLSKLRKTPDDLKWFFKDGTDVRGWLKGGEKLPADAQAIVAAWLSAPKWKVLTDQPPEPITDAELDDAIKPKEPSSGIVEDEVSEETNDGSVTDGASDASNNPPDVSRGGGSSGTPGLDASHSPAALPAPARPAAAATTTLPPSPQSAALASPTAMTLPVSSPDPDVVTPGGASPAVSTPVAPTASITAVGVAQKVEAGVKALTELAPLFPAGKFNTLLTEAGTTLKGAATATESQQQASLEENAPPILVATTFIKELSAFGSVVGLAFPPAALGLALANLAASLTETNYRRWYAGVMNEQYSPVKFAPEALDPSAAHTLVNRCSSWKDRMAGLMGDRDKVCAIVRAALAADMGEALWADVGFGVSALFANNRPAFDAAVDELRAEAKKVGVDEVLSKAPPAEGSGTGGNAAVMAEVEKIRHHGGARDAEAALDFLMTSLNWFKVNGPGLDQIIGQFRALGGH